MFKFLILIFSIFSVTNSAIASDPRPIMLSLSADTINQGESITVYTNGLSSGSLTDWIGLYYVSNSNDYRFLDWVYSGSCTKSVPVGDRPTPAGCAFSNLPPGNLVFRMFANNGYGLMADSPNFTVRPHPPLPISSVTVEALASPNQNVNAIAAHYLNNFALSVTDWLGLYRIGSDGRGVFITWKYTNTCSSVRGPAPVMSGTCLFGNLTGGRYQVVLFSNNGYSVIAVSDEFILP